MGPSRHRSMEGLLTHQYLSPLTANLPGLLQEIFSLHVKKEMSIKFRELPLHVSYINCLLYGQSVYPLKHLQFSQSEPVCHYQVFSFLPPQPHQTRL